MLTKQDIALQTTMEQEAETLVNLLTTPERCVMVHVIVAYNNDRVDHVHAVGGKTTTHHANQFLRALRCKYNWIVGSIVPQRG